MALQVLGRELGVVQTRDAGGGPDPHLVGVEPVRLGKGLEEAPHDIVRGGRSGEAFEQDVELVPAHPRREVAGPDGRKQPARDLDEEAVADAMAERVVDDLEVVEIEVHDGHPLPRAPCACDGRGHLLDEVGPIRQPGQPVVERLVRELRLEALLIGDVDHQPLDELRLAVRMALHDRLVVADPEFASVLREQSVLPGVGVGDGQSVRSFLQDALTILRVDARGPQPIARDPPIGTREPFLGGIAHHRLDLRAHVIGRRVRSAR